MSIQKQGYFKKKNLKKKKQKGQSRFLLLLKSLYLSGGWAGCMAPAPPPAEGACPWARSSRSPVAERVWDGHRCNLPEDTGEQHADLKELKVLLLSATEGFVKLPDLNLTDKHK